MSATCTILMNNSAGALHLTPGAEQLSLMSNEIGLDADVVLTGSAEEMSRKLRDLVARGVDRVAVAGGDGTVALAARELAHTSTALGIIPQGTANNFATALRLPQDLPSALRVLKDGEVREVDLGRVNGTYFTEAAGVGLFADALALYGPSNKNILKGLYALTRTLLLMRPSRVHLTLDGAESAERAVWCTAANTYRVAYAMPIAPGARLTDSMLDVVIVGDLTLKEIVGYYRAIRAQLHLKLPKVTSVQAREIKIASRRRMNVHCDDKVVGATPVTISADPSALKVLVEAL